MNTESATAPRCAETTRVNVTRSLKMEARPIDLAHRSRGLSLTVVVPSRCEHTPCVEDALRPQSWNYATRVSVTMRAANPHSGVGRERARAALRTVRIAATSHAARIAASALPVVCRGRSRPASHRARHADDRRCRLTHPATRRFLSPHFSGGSNLPLTPARPDARRSFVVGATSSSMKRDPLGERAGNSSRQSVLRHLALISAVLT